MSQRPCHLPAVMISQAGVSTFELDAEPLGDLLGDVDVEADDLVAVVDEGEGRVGLIGDLDQHFFGHHLVEHGPGLRLAGQRQRGEQGGGYDSLSA